MNELCIAGEIIDIVYKKSGICKFVVKSRESDFEILCSVRPTKEVHIEDIAVGEKVYVQGLYGLRRWINRVGKEVVENEFIITNLY